MLVNMSLCSHVNDTVISALKMENLYYTHLQICFLIVELIVLFCFVSG